MRGAIRHADAVNADWKRLYKVVKAVPKGRLATYGQIARAARTPGGARAAGRAMAACPRGLGIPWHRVVGAGGRLLIREPFAALQRRLLEAENVTFSGGRVDMKRFGWTPRTRKSNKRKL